ncbi:ABC-type amino acid transport/signal transduction systems, periplasmic component/domain [Bacillus sp. OxB-1]|uniref:hypothetical protein n=1 Tax=Bacillus sp. (strain OxB-1) TaxID=98228 RepID=UPI000581E2B8|nr:hypothetical protein [Bacillus sp. OxB-1]BAQ10754.1 ABC-type amino acid transport/signal transduction systems, periplasmic component/domain [Bacillus sp. OxB-1]
MKLAKPENKRWLKLGAATILSVSMLAACADDNDPDDVDVNVDNPPADVDDGTDTNIDMDVNETTPDGGATTTPDATPDEGTTTETTP